VDLFGKSHPDRGGRRWRWQPSVEECVPWLRDHRLTRQARTYRSEWPIDPGTGLFVGDVVTLGIPSHRAERKSKADLDLLKKSYAAGKSGKPLNPDELNRIWDELKSPANAVRALSIDRLPSDALGFYRPFHFSPHEEWGIYLMLEPILRYCEILFRVFKTTLTCFSLETLMGCVLFEVFHHEFFHHLSECAATTLEIVSARFGQPVALLVAVWVLCQLRGWRQLRPALPRA
jgi:hypothetical protein